MAPLSTMGTMTSASMNPTIVATATTSATATSSAAPTPTATSTPVSGKVDHSLICRNSYILYRLILLPYLNTMMLIYNMIFYDALAWAAWGAWYGDSCSNPCGNGTWNEARLRCKVNDPKNCEIQARANVTCVGNCTTSGPTSTPATGNKTKTII